MRSVLLQIRGTLGTSLPLPISSDGQSRKVSWLGTDAGLALHRLSRTVQASQILIHWFTAYSLKGSLTQNVSRPPTLTQTLNRQGEMTLLHTVFPNSDQTESVRSLLSTQSLPPGLFWT